MTGEFIDVTGEIPLDAFGLRHVLLVGGHSDEWTTRTTDRWNECCRELSAAASSVGVRWLTLRPYGSIGGGQIEPQVRSVLDLEPCGVVIDATLDGRQRFVDALHQLGDDPINEASVAASLYEPADGEPDLVVVCGPSDRLPPSLVWELAYAELVFTDVAWNDFGARDLLAACTTFGGRRRRFGGLDA